MTTELTCTKTIRVDDGEDAQGRKLYYHKKCGNPAAEYEVGGLLAKAKAVLCARHKQAADKQAFVSDRGYALGRVDKSAKGHHQARLPGTGVP
jgi:hypothetical protein